MSNFDKDDRSRFALSASSISSSLAVSRPRSHAYRELWDAFQTLSALPALGIGDREFASQAPIRLALLQRIDLLLVRWRAEIGGRDSEPERPRGERLTLGSLIYTDRTGLCIPEKEWIALIDAIAAGNHRALDALFERSHRLVCTLIARILRDQAAAEALTIDVFADVWRRASAYSAGDGTVVGWIMNEARSRAIDRLPASSQKDREARIDVLRPAWLRARLLRHIAAGTDAAHPPHLRLVPEPWAEPEWVEVVTGISCKLLSEDADRDRVSMLVRLAPGTDYPPHQHAGVEELHLLHGKLIVDERMLHPGDYVRAEPGSVDRRVWSGTGCTCVLTTSPGDILF